jgi:hypothetical protein
MNCCCEGIHTSGQIYNLFLYNIASSVVNDMKLKIICKILGFQGYDYEEYRLLGCGAV